MEKELYEDVKEVLKMFEGYPVGMARITLETALKALERHRFVSLKDFEIELKELDKNG